MSGQRRLVAILLVAAGVLFAIGTSYEAAERSEHGEVTQETAPHDEAIERSETSSERASEAAASEKADGHEGSSERILGIDAGSPVIIGLGIALSLAAAAIVLFVRRRPADLAVAGFAAVFGALDLAEAVHGLREGEPAIGMLALVIAGLHFAAAWFGSRLDIREPARLLS